MSFLEGGELSTIATLIGIPSLAFGLYLQIRSYRKSQKEEQEKSRKAITEEINQRATELADKMELKLDSIKVMSVVSKSDLEELRRRLEDLKKDVQRMDEEGTIEWRKVKPFVIDRLERLEEKITQLERGIIR